MISTTPTLYSRPSGQIKKKKRVKERGPLTTSEGIVKHGSLLSLLFVISDWDEKEETRRAFSQGSVIDDFIGLGVGGHTWTH